MMLTVQLWRLMLFFFLRALSSDWSTAGSPMWANELPHCQPVPHLVSLEKRGCPTCDVVETTICSGHCTTKERNVREQWSPGFSNIHQQVCTYEHIIYKTYVLPGCLPGVDPTVTYPMAVSCHCDLCNINTTQCAAQREQPHVCAKHMPPYYDY